MGEHAVQQLPRPAAAPQAGTYRHDVGVLQEVNQRPCVLQRLEHEFRARPDDRREMLGATGDGHQPRAHAKCRLTGQAHGTGHAGATADEQHAAEACLVRAALAPRQRLGDIPICQALQPRTRRRHIDLQRIKIEAPGVLGAVADKQTCLQRDIGDRSVGANGRVGDAAIRIQPGRHIQGQYRAAAGIDRGDHRGSGRAQRQLRAHPQQGIHYDLGVRKGRRLKAPDRHAAGAQILAGPERIALEQSRIGGRQDRHLQARRLRKARHDVAIATVVATAADHRDAHRLGPAATQHAQCTLARPLHQGVAGRAGSYRPGIDVPNLGDGVERDGQCHSRQYTDAP